MTRERTRVDEIADAHLYACAAADPLLATEIGIGGHDEEITDFSPEAITGRAHQLQGTLTALAHAPIADATDRVTVATMTDSLRRELALIEAGERTGECNVIASPLQAIRDTFDLMPTDTEAQRVAVVRRIGAIPTAVDGVIAALDHRIAYGPPLQRRQVELVAAQADGAVDSIAATTGSMREMGVLTTDLDTNIAAARTALGRLADHLRSTVAARAVERDAIGRDRYLLHLPHYLGADVDVTEAYAWACDHLGTIIDEQRRIAGALTGRADATIAEATAALDAEPRYQIHDKHDFVAWMQDLSDRAVAGLAGTHFDIPDRLSRLECRLAPSSTGIIYYTQPTADLSRPGRMWWSVPPAQHVFHTWQETTTVFHEGVPGHHLQLGSAIVDDDLNDWRKLASFTSGHGEGWALYAERLMADLGWLDDPGDRMGMLDSQRLRAARVVVDIGVHCELAAPDEFGGGTWTAESAWQFLTSSVAMDRAVLRFELNRYLGWPGQAPSYALGQRVWQQTRDAALRAHPDRTLRDFHSRALSLGGVSLDVLAQEMMSE